MLTNGLENGAKEVKRYFNNLVDEGVKETKPIVREFERAVQLENDGLTNFERKLIKFKVEVETALAEFKKYIESRLSCLTHSSPEKRRPHARHDNLRK